MLSKIHLAALTVAAIGLAGCEFVPFTPENRIENAKAQIAIQSANPTTIQWSDVKEHAGAVCGIFNAEERTNYGTEVQWSGPLNFVTIDGKPNVVGDGSDCETVAVWSRCVNEGDETKVAESLEQCRAYQAELVRQSDEQYDRFFKSEGLFQTGDPVRDRQTWTERQNQFDKGPQGLGREELSAQVDSWKEWKRAYNAHMRALPANATTEQKVAAAPEAVRLANAATEKFLADRGFR